MNDVTDGKSSALPTVLIPGLIASPTLFEPQLSLLWQRGPVVLADTRRGSTIEDIASQILEFAPPEFFLIGLSMGGYVAMEMIRQAPQRVLRLGLLDTSARPDTDEQTARRIAYVERVKSGEFASVVNEIYEHAVHPTRRRDGYLRSVFTTMAESVGQEAFVRQQHAIMRRGDARTWLSAVRCPTLALVGRQDGVTPPACAAEIAALVPQAWCRVVEDCGHLSTLERPAEVRKVLTDFIDRKE